MPYIGEKKREKLDPLIEQLAIEIDSMKRGKDGALEYVFYTLIHLLYDRRFCELNRAIGVLATTAMAIYRHSLGPYEDLKLLDGWMLE